MGVIELFLLAIGLSMDAFAVAICKGLAMYKINFKKIITVGLWFGGFQAIMPVAGFFLAKQFESYIVSFDHWIAFILLCIIGVNMIREALSHDEEKSDDNLSFKSMFLLAVATSIDALAVGITFAFLDVNILFSASLIGITTFIFSAVGVKIGNVFGARYKSKAEFCGGCILVFLGIKILLEHLEIINF